MTTKEYLIVSDVHGRRAALTRLLALHPNAAGVIFLGDGLSDVSACVPEGSLPLLAVRGNCDFFVPSPCPPDEWLLSLLGRRFLLTHGHRYGVKSTLFPLLAHARETGADAVLFGHTHYPFDGYLTPDGSDIPILFFNPGSLGSPPDGKPSFGILTLNENGFLCSHGTLPFV